MVCAKTRSELFETHHSPLSPVRTRRLRTRQHMQHTNGRTENRVSDARLRKCQHRSADHYHTHTPPCYPRARSERDRRSTIRSFTQLTRRPTSSHVRMHATPYARTTVDIGLLHGYTAPDGRPALDGLTICAPHQGSRAGHQSRSVDRPDAPDNAMPRANARQMAKSQNPADRFLPIVT